MASMIEICQNAFLRMLSGEFGQRRSRQNMIAEFERRLENIDRQYNNKYNFAINSTSGEGYRGISQNVKLASKNRISIANLKVNEVHTGRFLLCRVIRRCIKIVALSVLVEDPEGDVEQLSLYNWVQQSDIPTKDWSKWFTTSKYLPIGTVLVIKNPYYKIASDLDTVIRSDNPSDVIVLDNNHKLISEVKWSTDLQKGEKVLSADNLSADNFRHRGNDYFASNEFAAAINEYSSGIEMEPHNVTLLANRAEAYLRLNQLEKALTDVEIVLKHEHGHIKAAFRKGKALCGLKRYQESITTLQDLGQRMQNNTGTILKKNIDQLLNHAKMLDSENRNGKYDYIRIIDEFCEKAKTKDNQLGSDYWICEGGPRLDHADFLIDDIEIRPVKKRGKGWVAKCDIPENTLLMVSKAFKVVYRNETPVSFSTDSATSELITCIAQKLTEEPDLCKEVYQLYGGPDLVPVEKLNKNLLHSVDMKRIEKIIQYNAFEPKDCCNVFQNIGGTSLLDIDAGAGLWILPSYFNHSCVDMNVHRSIIGDLMFVRSCRPILKGEELVFSYCDPMSSYDERSKKLSSVYDINCQCRLCKLDRSELRKSKLRRDNILENFEIYIRPRIHGIGPHFDPSLVKELKKIVAELENLRKEHPDLEFQSFRPKTGLAAVYANSGIPHQSLSIMQEVYNMLKTNRFLPLISHVTFQIVTRYVELGKIKEAKKWFDITLKAIVEPLRGEFKDEETKWKKEALRLAEKMSPDIISFAKNVGLA